MYSSTASIAVGAARDHVISVAGVGLVADCAGAVYWPEQGLLAVADLHLEKGSSFAARGVLLPPYDTAATLARLSQAITRYAPRCVVALGDSFHDGDGPARIAESDRAALRLLQRGRDWIWILGNHDPQPAPELGGSFVEMLAIGAIVLRHHPQAHVPAKREPVRRQDHAPLEQAAEGEIAGHLHPVARIAQRGRGISRRCFAADGQHLVMPAFGAYAGGLNVRDRAFADVFGTLAFTAHLLGDARLYAVAAKRCIPD